MRWHIVSSADFKAGTKKDQDMYFLKDTKEIYRGDVNYSQSVILCDSFPESEIAIGKIYINTDTLQGKVYDGSSWRVVIEGYDEGLYPTKTVSGVQVEFDDHLAYRNLVGCKVYGSSEGLGDATSDGKYKITLRSSEENLFDPSKVTGFCDGHGDDIPTTTYNISYTDGEYIFSQNMAASGNGAYFTGADIYVEPGDYVVSADFYFGNEGVNYSYAILSVLDIGNEKQLGSNRAGTVVIQKWTRYYKQFTVESAAWIRIAAQAEGGAGAATVSGMKVKNVSLSKIVSSSSVTLDAKLQENEYVDFITKELHTESAVTTVTIDGVMKTTYGDTDIIYVASNTKPSKIEVAYFQDINKVVEDKVSIEALDAVSYIASGSSAKSPRLVDPLPNRSLAECKLYGKAIGNQFNIAEIANLSVYDNVRNTNTRLGSFTLYGTTNTWRMQTLFPALVTGKEYYLIATNDIGVTSVTISGSNNPTWNFGEKRTVTSSEYYSSTDNFIIKGKGTLGTTGAHYSGFMLVEASLYEAAEDKSFRRCEYEIPLSICGENLLNHTTIMDMNYYSVKYSTVYKSYYDGSISLKGTPSANKSDNTWYKINDDIVISGVGSYVLKGIDEGENLEFKLTEYNGTASKSFTGKEIHYTPSGENVTVRVYITFVEKDIPIDTIIRPILIKEENSDISSVKITLHDKSLTQDGYIDVLNKRMFINGKFETIDVDGDLKTIEGARNIIYSDIEKFPDSIEVSYYKNINASIDGLANKEELSNLENYAIPIGTATSNTGLVTTSDHISDYKLNECRIYGSDDGQIGSVYNIADVSTMTTGSMIGGSLVDPDPSTGSFSIKGTPYGKKLSVLFPLMEADKEYYLFANTTMGRIKGCYIYKSTGGVMWYFGSKMKMDGNALKSANGMGFYGANDSTIAARVDNFMIIPAELYEKNIKDYVRYGYTLQVNSCSDNLLSSSFSDTSRTLQGVTITDNSDGTVSISGTPDASIAFLLNNVSVTPGETYKISGISGNNIQFVINEYDSTNAQINTYSGTSVIYTASEQASYISVSIDRITTAVEIKAQRVRPWVEKCIDSSGNVESNSAIVDLGGTTLGANDYVELCGKTIHTSDGNGEAVVRGSLKTTNGSSNSLYCNTNILPSKIELKYYRDINKVLDSTGLEWKTL